MLQKSKSKKIFQLKYLLLVPIFMLMLMYNSCKDLQAESNESFITVNNVENLSEEEEVLLFETLKGLSEKKDDWVLLVKDKDSRIKFTKSTDGSFISGPNREKINVKLVIDSNFQSYKTLDSFESAAIVAERVGEEHNRLLQKRRSLTMNSFPDNPTVYEVDEKLRRINGDSPIGGSHEIPVYLISQVPIFPGCENSENPRKCFEINMINHIKKNFRYPNEAKKKAIQGEVIMKFKIDESGSVADIKAEGPNKLLEDEATRIISKLPAMIPGTQSGQNYGAGLVIPITFSLD